MSTSLNYSPQFSLQDVEIINRTPIYRGFVQLEKVTLRHKMFKDYLFGPCIQREVIYRREAAGVLVHDPLLKKFRLIEQFRAGALNAADTPWQLEIIAGLIDEGEDAPTCLTREALEEAGCHIENVKFLYRYYPSTGASDEVFDFYSATADLSLSGGIHGAADEGEDIKVHLFEYHQVDELLLSGYVRNAPLLIALQWFKLHLININSDGA